MLHTCILLGVLLSSSVLGSVIKLAGCSCSYLAKTFQKVLIGLKVYVECPKIGGPFLGSCMVRFFILGVYLEPPASGNCHAPTKGVRKCWRDVGLAHPTPNSPHAFAVIVK